MPSEDYILKPVIGKQIKLFAEILGAFNGGFESGPNAAMPTNWFHDYNIGSSSGFLASNTDPAHSGSFCAKANMVYTGSISERWAKPIGFSDHLGLGLDHSNLAKGFPVIPGYKYMIEGWGKKALAAQEVKVDFKWMNTGGIITHSPTSQVPVAGVGAYEKIYCIDYAPKNATMMNGLVKFKGTTTDGLCFIDDCQMWVPLGICSEIKIKADSGLTEILEWGAADPVENKEKANSYSGSFKNYYFSLYAQYLAKRMANGKLPEFTLRIVIEQGTDRRVLNLGRVKLGAWELGASVNDIAGESLDFKFIGITRESGGAY
jgi:hypothetical protein